MFYIIVLYGFHIVPDYMNWVDIGDHAQKPYEFTLVMHKNTWKLL